MKNGSHNKGWHAVSVQIHVDILHISLNKSKNNAKLYNDSVKTILRRDPMPKNRIYMSLK